MEQKEVKIIGLKINEQLGILQSCQLTFDPKNNLIAIKGEVGAGKTTLQKGLMLGTLGSDTLKDDKQLYGKIDEEVQLIDGDIKIYVGCKTNNKGSLDYVIYTKDLDGKIIKDPVIDGVKVTPATYLKSLQTALTWRMDEVTSENPTVQKKILLELYKSELANLGVIFDKKDPNYSESILGQIEIAESKRSEKDFLRKQVGGFQNQLEPLGIDANEPSTHPKRIDIAYLEAQKNKLQYDIENVGRLKTEKLEALKNKADALNVQLKEENQNIKEANREIEVEFEKLKAKHSQNVHTYNGICKDLETLRVEKCLTDVQHNEIFKLLENHFENIDISVQPKNQELAFNEKGGCISNPEDWSSSERIRDILVSLHNYRVQYVTLEKEPIGDTTSLEKELETVLNNIILAKENNKKCDMVDSYLAWSDAHNEVMELKNKYANMLLSVNTGVEGLNICVDKEENNLDIYLTYDGSYDPKYFGNENKEHRKLSSYSGTQKPLICLLLQNYLLSKKPKAMRYLWIDNVPIDNKTKALLEKMGKELGLTIIVNITGDFSKESLENGEILVEGGEVFFV